MIVGTRPQPLTPAERSRAYPQRTRARKRGVTSGLPKVITTAVTEGITSGTARAAAMQIEPRTTEGTQVAAVDITKPATTSSEKAAMVATKDVARLVTAPVTRNSRVAATALQFAAFVLAGVGVATNGWFANSLGSTQLAGWLFTAVGVSVDLAALALPCCAARAWRERHRAAAVTGWIVWAITFAFAMTAGIGFASVNIADTTLVRTGRTTPAIEVARAALADAKSARDRECARVGPICRQREDIVVERQRQLDLALRSVESGADPQTDAATRLVAWASFGSVKPSRDDFSMLRLLLLALLPQIGGVLLMLSQQVIRKEPRLAGAPAVGLA